MYKQKYYKYKSKYFNLKRQLGGKNDEFITDNDSIEISFFPKICKSNNTQLEKIKANEMNKKIITNFLKSEDWKIFLDYNFDQLRPYILPYYTPEMYYLDRIKTFILDENKSIKIVITGIIKKYSYEEVKNIYIKSDALNKTWNGKIKNKMTMKHLKDFIYEGFWKRTNEGEMLIDQLGYMRFDNPDEIKIKVDRI